MSSMPSKMPPQNVFARPISAKPPFARPIALIALATASLAAIATPSSAQMGGQSMVAQQQRPIGEAINQWEYLQKTRNLGFAQYASFAATYPDFPRMGIIRERAEAALSKSNPSSDAVVQYFDRQPPLTNQGRAGYALALASKQRPEAAKMALAAWRGGRMSDQAEAYILSMFGNTFTTADHDARADALLWQGQRAAATRQMIRLSPQARELAMARLSLLNGTMPRDAGMAIPNAATRDAGYMFNLVNHLRAKGQNSSAIQVFANRPAFAAPAFDAEELVSDMLALAEKASVADTVRIASRTDDLFAPDTDISQGSFKLRDKYTDLMWKGGTNALWRMNDGASAAQMFLRYGKAARTPLTRAKGFFWAGRAARAAGRTAEANSYFEMAAAYPHYYYGQLALSALGRPMPQFAALPQPSQDPDMRAAFNREPLTQAIRAIAANRRDWRTERRFFQAIGDWAQTPEQMALVHELSMQTGLPEMAVVIGMKGGENGLKGFERAGFPTVQTPVVNDWTMTHAISRQESEFDRTRKSHAGARGMMQLMPGTAREQAGKLGLSYRPSALFSDTQYNIKLGDAYFARMMDYYGGAYPLAVGAYNAGPGRVNQWLRLNGDPRRGDIDWVTWVEKIPANFETRYYIMRVIGNAVSYSHMYPEKAGLPRTVDRFLP